MNDSLPLALLTGGLLLAFITFALIFAKRYTRVGPDEALIISGMRQPGGETQRVVFVGGTFVWPVLEQARRFSLAPVSIAASNGRVLVDGYVRIRKEKKAVVAAAERFLSISPQEIGRIAGQVVESLLASDDVPRRAAEALAPMGLEIVSLTLKDRA